MPSITDFNMMECWEVDPPIKYYVKEYGLVSGEAAIMNEIFNRGYVMRCA
jgi:hypothetical protein